MRELIEKSWRRSRAAGIDADRTEAPVVMAHDELLEYRAGHMLGAVFPLLYDVLGRAAEDCDCVMAIGDTDARLLWVVGRRSALRTAEGIRFMEGTHWGEDSTGTNAPGTALRLDSAVQVSPREHFSVAFKDWSCSAAPIHHPETREILGVVDVTGQGAIDNPQTLAMVRSAARMAEAELGRLIAVRQLESFFDSAQDAATRVQLTGLGRPDLQLEWAGRTTRLSRRNSDIIAVLADQPDGLWAEQLMIETYEEDDIQPSTLRAQMTRLRGLLGDGVLQSRPYRFQVPVRCDWVEVIEALQQDRLADALRLYQGPLLPTSEAPGVVERRQRIERELIRALLATPKIDLLVSATRARWASDNLELWERQADLLPSSSPLLAVSLGEVQRLRREYGIPPMRLPNRLHRL